MAERRPSPRELGLVPLPGSARRYVDPSSGRVLSRRAVEDLRRGGPGTFRVEQTASAERRAEAGGWESARAFREARRDPGYQHFVEVYADLADPSPRQFSDPQSEFNTLYAAVVASDRDPHPDGPFAEFLVYIGERDEDDWWPVGSTPK